jgi:hypothetical protein
MLKLLLFALLQVSAVAWAEPCELSIAQIMVYEHDVLSTIQSDFKKSEEQFWLKGLKPFMCLLQIHQSDDSALKFYADAFLRPLLGGPLTPGAEQDPRYKQLNKILLKSTLQSGDLLNQSWISRYAKGSWGLYEGFCNLSNNDDCKYFVPDEKLIGNQSDLLAASSMLLLRSAYYSVDGKSRSDIAARIKTLYRITPKSNELQRRVIEAIYSEMLKFPIRSNPLPSASV